MGSNEYKELKMTKLTEVSQLAAYFDHTILKAEALPGQVDKICQEALEHHFYGVCVNTSYIESVAKKLSGSKVVPLAVVGFPLGAMAGAAKALETKWAVEHGAKEIDTVINVGAYLSGQEAVVREDIRLVVQAAGAVPVKVILETGYLQPDQIKELSLWCAKEGAKYVKTSTGFGPRGASVEDIQTMKAALDSIGMYGEVGIKASGGIRDLKFCQELIEAGATRIGASASVGILEEFQK